MLFAVNMLVNTDAGDTYTVPEISAWLTDAGFTALENAAPGHVNMVRKHLFDVLTEEQLDQLEQICLAIEKGLDNAIGTEDPCPGAARSDPRSTSA